MRRSLILIIIVIAALGARELALTGMAIAANFEPVIVERVIDGDTVVLSNGERVRLMGIDTPEKGEYLFEEAKQWLQRIEGQQVVLETGDEDRDKYGRLLRYIHWNGLVEEEILKQGLAKVFMLEPHEKHYEELISAEALAIEAGIGLWNSTL